MRLLLKANPAAIRQGLAIGGAAPIALRPLMPSIDDARGAALGIAGAAASWQVTGELELPGNAWDACHALVRDGLGASGDAGLVMAEPDLEQSWLPADQQRQAGAAAGGGAPQSDHYPIGAPDGWFADRPYSGLAAARTILGAAPPGLRIAHLDTGYDPAHRSKPTGLRAGLARNFADLSPDGTPGSDAFDRKTAAVNPMFGHGTATLALLAGEPYGGARGFEVVPLRVANWVTLFANSAIAAALDYVHHLAGSADTRCDVVSMSMGGAPSAVWADAVNALYEAGVAVVTAAGNNFGNLPVRSIVYPARFNRVLAACGVMADGKPYADLGLDRMAGCYGPARKMRTALSAWTPNAPWAVFGQPDRVDQDGGGTSAATPQIAAATALWLERHRQALTGHSGWQRVEAARLALFRAAGRDGPPDARLGRGVLHADAALGFAPALPATLRKEAEDHTDFAVLRLLTGIGAAASPHDRMFHLEALQIAHGSAEVQAALGGLDPEDARLADHGWRAVLAAVADAPACSAALRGLIRARLPAAARGGPAAPAQEAPQVPAPRMPPPAPPPPAVPVPDSRQLQVFAFDPGFATRMATRRIATAVVAVEWEDGLRPGPVGAYVEVIDIDPASDRAYAPVDLNAPELLAQDGLAPSDGSPQFHQQMAYAVAMRTIGHFKTALGRAPLWAELVEQTPQGLKHRFVRRLRIYPHALREPNAYYSPEKRALLLGYFRALAPGATEVMRGGMIFTCLSHDIVAHETTHALLDGLHPRWKEPTNPDAPAFHEAFADMVALFQHFTMREALLSEIRQARGRLRFGPIMGKLARQFGQAIGGRGALRDAIGRPPSPTDYADASEPHALGEVLVAAVFDAWVQVYEDRTADLFRLATGGTGVLPRGEIPHDLAGRLADEAAKLAGHFLNICIRALDYCPPVDPTFGEYLRALITADADLVRDDPYGYRVALVDGFRRRGILPEGVQTWSPDALIWQRPDQPLTLSGMTTVLDGVGDKWDLASDRLAAWRASRANARKLHAALTETAEAPSLWAALGLLAPHQEQSVDGGQGITGGIEVHSVRPTRRVGPDGQLGAAVVIELTQRWQPKGDSEWYRGGCTIIWDRAEREVRYLIYKRVGHGERTARQQAFRMAAGGSASASYFRRDQHAAEPFALMHSDH
ncbi:MAG: hypothetical protein BGP12_08300 [Rhodospirillales bacterium 70-18]|nr:MAG: hypothetical protein BGP12_08300 [Rhodospirillales bacterium 70-18]